MTTKEKELISVAASVAAGCEPCTRHHVAAAHNEGAQAKELSAMARIALDVRERATRTMAATAALAIEGRCGPEAGCACSETPGRLEALAGAASALAAQCGSGVPGFLASAQKAGADPRECELALALARKIKKVASEKTELAALNHPEAASTASCAQARECSGPSCC